MSDPEFGLPPVPVQRISLGPGDRLAVVYPGPVSAMAADRVRDRVRELVGPDVPVIILDHGPELRVVSGGGDGLPVAALREDVRGAAVEREVVQPGVQRAGVAGEARGGADAGGSAAGPPAGA